MRRSIEEESLVVADLADLAETEVEGFLARGERGCDEGFVEGVACRERGLAPSILFSHFINTNYNLHIDIVLSYFYKCTYHSSAKTYSYTIT